VFNALLAVVMYVGYEVVIDELEQDDELHEFDSELCVTFDLTLVVSSVLPVREYKPSRVHDPPAFKGPRVVCRF